MIERYCIRQKGRFCNFHKNLSFYTGIVCKEDTVIYKAKLEECSSESYDFVAWKDKKRGICFIFHTLTMLECCFQYGTKPEIEKGSGNIIYLKLMETREAGKVGMLYTQQEEVTG